MKLGGYVVDVNASGNLPQKVQSGFDKIFGSMVGASYVPIAYLGSKTVNGTNHAILATQTLVTGVDVKSVVLIVLNEKPGDVDGSTVTLVGIDPLITNGGALGGVAINPVTEIPEDAKKAFDKRFANFVGAENRPFALLATQMVRGGVYYFAVESTMLVSPTVAVNGKAKSVYIVKVYDDFDEIETMDVIQGASPDNGGVLGYAFNWLKAGGNTSVWP